jgi:hypothetical protein
VCENADDYASNVFAAPYLQLGYVNGATNVYIREMGRDSAVPYAEYPTSVAGGGAASYYCDYYYQSAVQYIASLGAAWYSGAAAGVSSWLLYFTSADAYMFAGGRLLKKAL